MNMRQRHRNSCKGLVASLAIALTLTMTLPSFGALNNIGLLGAENVYGASSQVVFDNTGTGKENIALNEARNFKVTADLAGKVTSKELQSLVKKKNIQWYLQRKTGYQDSKTFPYQYMGGKLENWKLEKTDANKGKTKFFRNIKMEAKGTTLTLKMSNRRMFGVRGVASNNADYDQVSNRLLDYTGTYKLIAKTGKKVLAETSVDVRPYDSFVTQSEIDKDLFKAEKAANANGYFAEVKTYGQTELGNDMNAIFIADSEKTISDFQKIKEKAETNPEALIKEIKAGTLEYKVPVFYSNIHSNETPGSDANMNFIWDMIGAKEGKLTYTIITGFTEGGKERLALEKKQRKVAWSDLIKDYVTGVGFIRGTNDTSNNQYGVDETTIKDMKKYYTMEEITVSVDDILKNVFFIVVPSENVDAKSVNVRHNSNSFDLNRDNTFQTQSETKAMTKLIADWNPISFVELHGYIAGFQIEPCSPTHEPNIEYDLFAKNGIEAGEAFGNAAIANNKVYNSFVMPLRDYLTDKGNGKVRWDGPWDDMSTSYTPQYALLHGAIAYTIECPNSDESSAKALEYGLINQAKYIADNKDKLFLNQLEVYKRGLNNTDADSVRPWYVDIDDKAGAEADIFRAKYKENNNFFPEYYVIPNTSQTQQDVKAAYEMGEWLMRNGVVLKELTQDVKLGDKEYAKGSFIVDMHQAKRNVANAALYTDILIENWSDLYSEPLTAFAQLRGFDYSVITKVGAFSSNQMKEITTLGTPLTAVEGEKGSQVIISNNNLESTKAINKLLADQKKVGYITEGDNKGDFIVAYDDFSNVKDKFVLQTKRVETAPAAKVIKKAPKVYIAGKSATFMKNANNKPFGARNYGDRDNYFYGWDKFAYGEQMGFKTVTAAKNADVIVGNQPVNKAALGQIKAGKPYIAYGTQVLDTIKDLNIGFDWTAGYYNMEDALSKVEYVDSSIVTEKYVMEKDDIMYGYGGARITKVPKNAKVLIKTTADKPIEGFMLADNVKKYANSIQAIEYKSKKYDLTVFANSLTNKAHQQDDYRYISNAIFSKMLGGDYTEK